MMFEGLPRKHFGAIATDCGTPFDAYSAKGETSRSPQKKYTTNSDAELAALPVGDYAARDSFLFYWDTTARIAVGRHIPIIKAWGFKPTAFAFTWFKLNKREPATPFFLPRHSMRFGPGLTTRKNTEVCILARRGKPKRLSASVPEQIFAPIREHSQKPEEFFDLVEEYCAGPYLELFSRRFRRKGWTTRGDQSGQFAQAAE
jgi:N6-adenosine-specific RNA methylase IME4